MLAGGLQDFWDSVRPLDAAELRSEDRRSLLPSVRSSGDHGGRVPLVESSRRPENVAGEDDRTSESKRNRGARKPILKAGEAGEEEEEAKGSGIYLSPRLRRPPDVGGFRGRRWSSSGRRGRCPLFARVGVVSE